MALGCLMLVVMVVMTVFLVALIVAEPVGGLAAVVLFGLFTWWVIRGARPGRAEQ